MKRLFQGTPINILSVTNTQDCAQQKDSNSLMKSENMNLKVLFLFCNSLLYQREENVEFQLEVCKESRRETQHKTHTCLFLPPLASQSTFTFLNVWRLDMPCENLSLLLRENRGFWLPAGGPEAVVKWSHWSFTSSKSPVLCVHKDRNTHIEIGYSARKYSTHKCEPALVATKRDEMRLVIRNYFDRRWAQREDGSGYREFGKQHSQSNCF